MKKYLPLVFLFIIFAACESRPQKAPQPGEEHIDSVVNVRDTSMIH